MENAEFKWRVEFSGPPCWGEYFLKPLPAAKGLDPTYLHKPGDIDYSPLYRLTSAKKAEILYYVATGVNPDGYTGSAIEIAACILVDRLSSPGFIPEVLNPLRWNF